MKYRMYIDEVGNNDLESSDNPNHRFLSLTGIIMDLEYVSSVVHPQMEDLKYRYFYSHPDDPVVFHRKEMVNALPPFERLRDVSIKEEFNCELLNHIRQWEYSVISACIDKKKHKETYSVWRYDPYHYLLAVLLERYFFFLRNNKTKGDVLAESRGGKEDMRLKDSFHGLWKNGTEYIASEKFQGVLTSEQLHIKKKTCNVCGLQIADLLAHPSRNDILKEQNLLSSKIAPFAESVIEILQTKYYRNGNRVYGKIFI